MAYNAQDGSLSAKPYAPSQGVPTDARSYYYDSALYKWRPYQSTAEVLAFLDTPAKRTGHFSIFIHSGTLNTSNGTFSGGSVTEYYFKDGISDASLVLKTAPGSSTSLDGLSDVVVSSPVLHQVLQYDGTQWVNQQLAGYANNYPTSVSFNASTNVLTIARNGLSDLTVDLSDLQDSGGTADGNNYPTALSFNSSTNVLTISRSGLADLTVDLSDLQDTAAPNLQQVLSAGSTLSQDNTVEMGAHDLIFSTDASNYNKLLPASFEIRRGRGSMLAQDDWAVAQLQTTDQVHTARFQVYPVSASSFTSEIRAWDQTVNNWKNVAVAANAQTGIKLEVNPSWQTSNDTADYRSLRVVSGDGAGQAAIEIDPELLPDATGGEVALSWDETTGQVRKGGTPGGGSSYTPTITTASTSQTLSTDYETWVFTGSSAATFTLPASGTRYVIKSRGTGTLTVSGTLFTTSAQSSLTLYPGEATTLQWDGSYWIAY